MCVLANWVWIICEFNDSIYVLGLPLYLHIRTHTWTAAPIDNRLGKYCFVLYIRLAKMGRFLEISNILQVRLSLSPPLLFISVLHFYISSYFSLSPLSSHSLFLSFSIFSSLFFSFLFLNHSSLPRTQCRMAELVRKMRGVLEAIPEDTRRAIRILEAEMAPFATHLEQLFSSVCAPLPQYQVCVGGGGEGCSAV